MVGVIESYFDFLKQMLKKNPACPAVVGSRSPWPVYPPGRCLRTATMSHGLMSAPGLAMVRVVVDAWSCDSRAELRRQGEPCI